jgi:hypothetical protein
MYKQMRKGRKGFSQYAIHGARPLERISDLLHDDCLGSAVALDEVGRILPARDWTNEDEIEALVFEIHRHHGLDIGYAVQAPSQVSASLRRLTGEWIYPRRVGLDPTKLLRLDKVPKWYQKPFGFRTSKYFPDPSDESGMPRILHKKLDGSSTSETHNEHIPVERAWMWYSQAVANMYDTAERIYTDAIQLEIEERLLTAKARLNQPQWVVQEGHSVGAYTRLQRARDDEQIRARANRRKRGRKIRIETQPGDEYSSFDLSQYMEDLQRDATANATSIAKAVAGEASSNGHTQST